MKSYMLLQTLLAIIIMVVNGVTLEDTTTERGHPVVQEDTRPPSGTNIRAPITGKFFYTKLHPGPR